MEDVYCGCCQGRYRKVFPFLLLSLIIGFICSSILHASYIYTFYESEQFVIEDAAYNKRNIPEEKVSRWYAENSKAAELAENISVLCWIMTMPRNHGKEARAVKMTWGSRCTFLLFMSSASDDSLPTVVLPVTENRNELWTKTREAFRYIYRNGYLDKVDWILKADDDTFVVMENLRHLLSNLDPNQTLYLGLPLRLKSGVTYMSGGAGYILSRTAARLLVEEGLPLPNNCSDTGKKYEDVEMGRCMAAVGAQFVDTRDEEGRNRFYPYCPHKHMAEEEPETWLRLMLVNQISQGMECCSRSAISFHYVPSTSMYDFYFFIYNFRPYGYT